MSQTMSMVVGPLQAALEEAIKAQQGLQLEVAQLTLKIEDLKEQHGEYIKDVSLMYAITCTLLSECCTCMDLLPGAQGTA